MEKTTLADKYLTFSEESKKLLKPEAVELLIDTFNKVWRGICDFFNNGEIRDVIFEPDPEFGSPAMITVFNTVTTIVTDDDTGEILSESTEKNITENNKIKFNPHDQIFKQQPMDIDFITHELIHVAQNYKFDSCPSWICEGIADYGREKFGVYNTNWSIPKYNKNHSYEIGYTVTAAFFIWIEKNIDSNFVKNLNNAVKSDQLGENVNDYFIKKTSKTVDELWKIYAETN